MSSECDALDAHLSCCCCCCRVTGASQQRNLADGAPLDMYVEVMTRGPILCVPQKNGNFAAVLGDQVPEAVQVLGSYSTMSAADH